MTFSLDDTEAWMAVHFQEESFFLLANSNPHPSNSIGIIIDS